MPVVILGILIPYMAILGARAIDVVAICLVVWYALRQSTKRRSTSQFLDTDNHPYHRKGSAIPVWAFAASCVVHLLTTELSSIDQFSEGAIGNSEMSILYLARLVILMILIVHSVRNEEHKRTMSALRLACIAAATTVALSILDRMVVLPDVGTKLNVGYGTFTRMQGLMGGSNYFGFYVGGVFIVSLFCLHLAATRVQRLALTATSTILAIGVVLSMSRGAIVALVLSLLVIALSITQKVRGGGGRTSLTVGKAALLAGIATAWLAILGLLVAPPAWLEDRIQDLFDGTGSGRTDRWLATYEAMSRNGGFSLLVGNGFGSYRAALSHGDPHNSYLFLAMEVGIAAVMTILVWSIFAILKMVKFDKCHYAASLSVYLLTSLFLGLPANSWVG